ncbi:FUSC family protein [Paraburkholderia humisilvae]|uniref:p-hydroxybenzoic acid efflux pump subunit AaeB n=1 Tax=Paraburkholderia humisilvae TaxID=627669 RepID=A0A6J5EXH9_9BURK|nr:FUSC family protein [Paraburkholderia humisilvae]CAB3769942.1 p-hydroxybenzoic acid efflux pump subunit AaeB [Paraburkholderia humisilvae]
MTNPSVRDWLFSAKTFLAAMIALYIALAVPLERPSWAMASVYIVSNPFVGATRSKALFRAIGTAMGAAASILIVPPFVESPYLFSVLVALWTGAMVYMSLADRTARSYVFLLAGLTLPLVALPTVTDPTTIFDVAIARTEEILLGIICASVVGSLVLPSRLGPTLIGRTDAWFADAQQFAHEALAARGGAVVQLPRQQRLAATVKALDVLLGQLSYDHASPEVVARAFALRERMQLFLPVLSALTDPMAALRSSAAIAHVPLFEPLMADVCKWIDASLRRVSSTPITDGDTEATHLRARIAALRVAVPRGLAPWDRALLSNTLWRVQLAIDIWEDCLGLRALIDQHHGSWEPRFRHWRVNAEEVFVDHGFMLFSAISTICFIVVACSLWIASGWHDGANAVFIAAVACCFFGGLDEPAPAIFRFFLSCFVAVIASGIYLFVVLPEVHNFETLVLVFAVPFLIIGTLIANPKFNQVAAVISLFTATFMSLAGSYDANFMVFINTSSASLAGLVFAFVWTRVTRPFGAEYFAQRLIRATWADVVRAVSGPPISDERTFFSRMLDRLMQVLPRLATSGPHHHPSVETFRDLRVATNSLDLRHYRDSVVAEMSEQIDRVLTNVRTYYELCVARRRRQPVPRGLIEAIDAALARIAQPGAGGAPPTFSTEIRLRDAVHALVGLRLSLAPLAPGAPAVPAMPGPAPAV